MKDVYILKLKTDEGVIVDFNFESLQKAMECLNNSSSQDVFGLIGDNLDIETFQARFVSLAKGELLTMDDFIDTFEFLRQQNVSNQAIYLRDPADKAKYDAWKKRRAILLHKVESQGMITLTSAESAELAYLQKKLCV